MDILQSSLPFSFTVSRDDSETLTTKKTDFASRFRAARLKAGMKRRLVAKLLEVHPETVIRWEKGIRTPGANMFRKIFLLLAENALPDLGHLGISGKMKIARLKLGLSQKAAALQIGKTEWWWRHREERLTKPNAYESKLLENFIYWSERSNKSSMHPLSSIDDLKPL